MESGEVRITAVHLFELSEAMSVSVVHFYHALVDEAGRLDRSTER